MKKYSLVVFDWYEILFQFTQILIGFAGIEYKRYAGGTKM